MILTTAELFEAAQMSLRLLQRSVGTTHALWNRYSESGIPLELADKWSERLGLHPAEVWTSWVDVVLAA